MAETEVFINEEKSPPPPPPLPPVPLSLSKKMSNACELDLQRVARNKETDSNIFALGEAVSQLDIDDVLSGVGSDFSELLNADNGSVTSTSCRLPLTDKSPTLDKYATVQVSFALRYNLSLWILLGFVIKISVAVLFLIKIAAFAKHHVTI